MDPNDQVIILAAYAAMLCSVAVLLAQREGYFEERNTKRRLNVDEIPRYEKIINTNDVECRDQIRMGRKAFFRLRDILKARTTLRDTMRVSLEEQIVMFLHTLSHNLRNKNLRSDFCHSGETISRHFHRVCSAVLSLHDHFLKQSDGTTPPEILANNQWYPYFKDCIGAIDGTHIPVTVDNDLQTRYRNRKGFLSQNVMGACSFDLKFQYVLAGWEGSGIDSRILASALSRAEPLKVPLGKYFLVDAGYPNIPGFLAPYPNTRYDLKEFSQTDPIRTPTELFNYRHSSLRNAIERTFGVLKARFPILKTATTYPIETQVQIVLACCLLHNFIISEDGLPSDEVLDVGEFEDESFNVAHLELFGRTTEEIDVWEKFRDDITARMWADYGASE